MRSALATAAERRVVCDSFAGKQQRYLTYTLRTIPTVRSPYPPNDISLATSLPPCTSYYCRVNKYSRRDSVVSAFQAAQNLRRAATASSPSRSQCGASGCSTLVNFTTIKQIEGCATRMERVQCQ